VLAEIKSLKLEYPKYASLVKNISEDLVSRSNIKDKSLNRERITIEYKY